eukprot:TRINITY_DN6709_c0_g1_i1.p2 TRINITY_DN6709_c0_g1~~TRINITY_DN6709_c0_g1_i1.p2  ORF type:complete len:178 (+),score=27.65 TRINITY_DN6709_c0_g1_i1:607-1140(+)
MRAWWRTLIPHGEEWSISLIKTTTIFFMDCGKALPFYSNPLEAYQSPKLVVSNDSKVTRLNRCASREFDRCEDSKPKMQERETGSVLEAGPKHTRASFEAKDPTNVRPPVPPRPPKSADPALGGASSNGRIGASKKENVVVECPKKLDCGVSRENIDPTIKNNNNNPGVRGNYNHPK